MKMRDDKNQWKQSYIWKLMVHYSHRYVIARYLSIAILAVFLLCHCLIWSCKAQSRHTATAGLAFVLSFIMIFSGCMPLLAADVETPPDEGAETPAVYPQNEEPVALQAAEADAEPLVRLEVSEAEPDDTENPEDEPMVNEMYLDITNLSDQQAFQNLDIRSDAFEIEQEQESSKYVWITIDTSGALELQPTEEPISEISEEPIQEPIINGPQETEPTLIPILNPLETIRILVTLPEDMTLQTVYELLNEAILTDGESVISFEAVYADAESGAGEVQNPTEPGSGEGEAQTPTEPSQGNGEAQQPVDDSSQNVSGVEDSDPEQNGQDNTDVGVTTEESGEGSEGLLSEEEILEEELAAEGQLEDGVSDELDADAGEDALAEDESEQDILAEQEELEPFEPQAENVFVQRDGGYMMGGTFFAMGQASYHVQLLDPLSAGDGILDEVQYRIGEDVMSTSVVDGAVDIDLPDEMNAELTIFYYNSNNEEVTLFSEYVVNEQNAPLINYERITRNDIQYLHITIVESGDVKSGICSSDIFVDGCYAEIQADNVLRAITLADGQSVPTVLEYYIELTGEEDHEFEITAIDYVGNANVKRFDMGALTSEIINVVVPTTFKLYTMAFLPENQIAGEDIIVCNKSEIPVEVSIDHTSVKLDMRAPDVKMVQGEVSLNQPEGEVYDLKEQYACAEKGCALELQVDSYYDGQMSYELPVGESEFLTSFVLSEACEGTDVEALKAHSFDREITSSDFACVKVRGSVNPGSEALWTGDDLSIRLIFNFRKYKGEEEPVSDSEDPSDDVEEALLEEDVTSGGGIDLSVDSGVEVEGENTTDNMLETDDLENVVPSESEPPPDADAENSTEDFSEALPTESETSPDADAENSTEDFSEALPTESETPPDPDVENSTVDFPADLTREQELPADAA